MLENLLPLNPVTFFAFQIPCYFFKNKFEKRHRVPDLSSFIDGTYFADVWMGWQEKGIHLQFEIEGAFDQMDFPDFRSSDSIELFFDTRDVKTANHATKFCHHFFVLPDAMALNGETIQAKEITRFRGEEAHELCDPSLLCVHTEKQRKKTILTIFIPSECLHGYDPVLFDRLGFTYKINRMNGERQTFSASDTDFSIEKEPSQWASLKLVKDN